MVWKYDEIFEVRAGPACYFTQLAMENFQLRCLALLGLLSSIAFWRMRLVDSHTSFFRWHDQLSAYHPLAYTPVTLSSCWIWWPIALPRKSTANMSEIHAHNQWHMDVITPGNKSAARRISNEWAKSCTVFHVKADRNSKSVQDFLKSNAYKVRCIMSNAEDYRAKTLALTITRRSRATSGIYSTLSLWSRVASEAILSYSLLTEKAVKNG